jgi:CBS domain-containing protein
MQVEDIMTREVELVDTDTSIAYVAKKMRAHDIGIVPVCDRETLVGTITDRDITVRATANNLHPSGNDPEPANHDAQRDLLL